MTCPHPHRWRILLRTGALGDFLLTLPLLQALATPDRPLCLVTRGACRALLPDTARPARFLDINGPDAARLFADSANAPDAFRDLLPGSEWYLFCAQDPALESRLRRWGARDCIWLNSRPTHPPHVTEHFFRDANLPVPPDLYSRSILQAPQETPRGRFLWLHPGSGSPAKNAPSERFAEFANDWRRAGGALPIRISFGEADAAVEGPILARLRARAIDFETVRNPSLADLRARLTAQAARFVGNDTGPTHLAAALGIPTVALFQSTDPAIWRPLGRHVQVS